MNKTIVLSILGSLSIETAKCQSLPLALAISGTNNNQASITFPTENGNTYRVLISNTLDSNARWTSATNILGNGDTNELTIATDSSEAKFVRMEIRKNPLYAQTLYVETNSLARAWVNAHLESDTTNALLMQKIATNSVATWLTGNEGNVASLISIALTRAGTNLPVFVLYNIPHRDCGSYSRGGAASGSAYSNWVMHISSAIDTNRAVLIVEPDALAGLDCSDLNAVDRNERNTLIMFATDTLKALPNAHVYVDAGHSAWQSTSTMIARLKAVHIERTDGFSLNVSNFETDANLIRYGTNISKGLNDIHFVIDSSRNGLGPNKTVSEPWCNPPGRALGKPPNTETGHPLLDAYLWIKNPAESDGACREGAPAAGVFYPEYALGLAERAVF